MYEEILITEEMVGHKLGEYVPYVAYPTYPTLTPTNFEELFGFRLDLGLVHFFLIDVTKTMAARELVWKERKERS